MTQQKDLSIKEFVSKPLFDENVILSKDASYPKISIITPSYNQAHFIERTILSVLNQNYPNLEYIIVEDGSKDNSIEVIKKYEKYLTLIVSPQNEGQSGALNRGFAYATGEIIGWQNSDDVYLPGAFLKAVEQFKKYKGIDIFYSNRFDINEKDDIIGQMKFTKFSKIVYQYDGISVSNQSAFWKKGVFDKVGLLDVTCRFSMDYEFYLRSANKGITFKYVNEYWGSARRYAENRTDIFIDRPEFKSELRRIDAMYDKKEYLAIFFKMYALCFRVMHYILQGDAGYVFSGLARRIKNNSLVSGR